VSVGYGFDGALPDPVFALPVTGSERALSSRVVAASTQSFRVSRGPHLRAPTHYGTKHLQQGIESDHFRVKRAMPRVGGFRSFNTARRTTRGFEAMLWLRKGFGFSGPWTVREQNQLLAHCFGLPAANKA